MAKGSEIFFEVLNAARKQLLLDFGASKEFGHAGIKGEERSEALGDFLRSRLPPAFGVASGEVVDSGDRRTGQVDLIIYDQTVTKPIHAGRKNELYPCEAAYALVEVKSLLTRTELEKCVSAAQKLRKLKPFKERFVDARRGGAEIEGKSHRCMYIVFAYGTDLSAANWLDKEFSRLVDVAKLQSVALSYVDRLIVLDRGLINPGTAQGKLVDGDPVILFAEFFLHLVNFLERERKRRPVLEWQQYGLASSKGWKRLTSSNA